MVKKNRGATLGTVLIAILVAVLVTFVAAGNGIWDLRLSVSVDERATAKNLADSAIALALAEVAKNEQYGKNRETLRAPVPAGLDSDSLGVVTFDPDVARGFAIPASVNSIGSFTTVPAGDGATVPISSVRLVGLGRSGSEVYKSECVFYRPPTPNGIIASGEITAEALFLAGLKDATAFLGTWEATDESAKREANIFSAGRDTGTLSALQLLGGQNRITGDAGTAGTVAIGSGSIVEGEVRQGVAPINIPKFDLDDMIRQVRRVQGEWPFPPPNNDTEIVGLRYYGSGYYGEDPGPGVLRLDGVIAVNGDVVLNKRLEGQGAIIATGDVTLNAGSDLDTENVLAIAAGGDLQIQGGFGSNYFRGLLYSEGDLKAENITILGTVITNSSPGKGKIDLKNVNIYQTDSSVSYNQSLPMWGSFAGGNTVSFEETSNEDGCWVVQLTRRSIGTKTVYDVRMYMNTAASDLTDGRSDYQTDGRGNVYFSEQDDPGGGWYQEKDGLTQAEAMEYITGRMAGHEPGASEFRTRLVEFFDAQVGSATVPILNFDLNNVLHPVERAKIVRWAAYQPPS